jgi:hypothetical protein
MKRRRYVSMQPVLGATRRDFLKTLGAASAVAAGGIVLGRPTFGEEKPGATEPAEVVTNLDEFMKVPRGPHAIPGPFPGRVVQVSDSRSLEGDRINAKVVASMMERGITRLTGSSLKKSFRRFFDKSDVVGIKVNPVGAPLINAHAEVVAALVAWLEAGGIARRNIVIWDRFDDMLKEAGYTAERFPGVRIEALQTMAEEGKSWRNESGEHISAANFDRDVYYYAKGIEGRGIQGYQDDEFYQNQHVFNGEYSYFGKLVTRVFTKIINVSSFKNTGNGISMATKNLGYGAICNTGRLHAPLFFRVCTEVLAAPAIRDKLVLNVTDGLRGQYDGGPMLNEAFVYPNHSLYFATDPFALDMTCHQLLLDKRKTMQVKVNEHPRFTDYLRQGERLGLGLADPSKIQSIVIRA